MRYLGATNSRAIVLYVLKAQLAKMPVTTNYKPSRASWKTSNYAKWVPIMLAVLLTTSPQWSRLGEDHTE